MKKLLIFTLTFVLALLVIPLLIPIPQLEGLEDRKQFTDEDSKFVEIEGIDIHYKDIGHGERTYILLHGFGASTYSFRDLIPTLSETSRVVAYDRPAFGLTERPTEWTDFNPYTPEAQLEILLGLIEELELENITLLGHSAGGLVAVNAVLEHPDLIDELVLIAPAIYEAHRIPKWVLPLLNTPQMNRIGLLLARSIKNNGYRLLEMAWYDSSLVTEEEMEEYSKPLQIEGWDVALWNLTKSTYSLNTVERLGEINIPTIIITGDSDTIVSTENSIRLSEEVSNSSIYVIEECGHIPHEEKPNMVLDILTKTLTTTP